MIKTLIANVKEYKKEAILTPIFAALEVFMEVLIPFIISSLIDKGIEAGNINNVYLYGGLMILAAFLSLFFAIGSGMCAARSSTGFGANLRDALYAKIQTFSFSNIDNYSSAGLVTRMTTDVTNVQNAFQMCTRIAVRAPLMLICSLTMCIFINFRLSMIFLVAILILGSALAFITLKTYKIFSNAFEQYDFVNSAIQENVSAIRVVKAYVREEYENSKFRNIVEKMMSLFVKAESILAFNNPIMMFVVYSCIIALSWFGAKFIVLGDLTPGELTSMFSYVNSILGSLMMLSMIYVMLSMSIASAERICEVLNEDPDLKNKAITINEVKDGSIEFRNVNFSYKKDSDEYVLEDLNFAIKSGETIGIVGGTGSGKTSLVSLISRLYDATTGEVLVGGVNVKDYDMEHLRNMVSVVLQKNTLFSGTILDNLRWGNELAADEECKEACKLASADDFIENFPDKYNTWIEQGGTNVSGGQKQRLCIARALLKNPKILILDDSTSAVDTATDAKIRHAFKYNIPDVTKLIIAQRVSSVKDADRILVLDDGKLSAFGTHDELLKTNDIYREMYETQTQGGGDFDEKGII